MPRLEIVPEAQPPNDPQLGARGRLKVFLGASAGVGKTFAMLSEAHEQRRRGVDVVVGYVETHGRAETQALLDGLDQLPLRESEYRGVILREFDLDAVLARRPELVLVDELAHSNVPGSRHAKRWQDVAELLRYGINVLTAVNIQHLESLNDVIAQITGVIVRETVPDSFVESADEIEVVDIPPEELRQRLTEGKVYIQEKVEQALDGFFRKGNLIALRELALRRAADRVDAEMAQYRSQFGITGTWATRERIMVCVAPNSMAKRVVRVASRIAAATHAQLVAVYVESDSQANKPSASLDHAREALRLAETLGMETATLGGHDIVHELLAYANAHNVSLIVVGKPIKPKWREVVFGSVVDELVRRSEVKDVHVVTGAEDAVTPRRTLVAIPRLQASGFFWAVFSIAVATGVCFLIHNRIDRSNLIMVYLLGVVFVASRFGPREAILASLLSVLAFDVAFVPPRWSIAVSDSQYVFTFIVMLTVALVISLLTLRLRGQAASSADRERRTASLFELSRDLARHREKRQLAASTTKAIRDVFNTDVAVLVAWPTGLEDVSPSESGFETETNEAAVAEWVHTHNETAGKDTLTLPGAQGLYVPLRGSTGAVGVLAFLPNSEQWPLPPPQRNLLETFANTLGLAIERANLAQESQAARVAAEAERIRSSLLSSISHDLRTPLTAIAGAASSLKAKRGDAPQLADTIYDESLRLNLQVQNLLDMTRLQSGEVKPNLEWLSLEEAIGPAIERTTELLGARKVTVDLPADLPMLQLDAALITKVFTNLLENAASYTPEDSEIHIGVDILSQTVRVNVTDNGPGIPKGEEARIFERFTRPSSPGRHGGFGLGLAITRAVMRLHEGRVWAENAPSGGAIFHLEFRKPTQQPEVPRG